MNLTLNDLLNRNGSRDEFHLELALFNQALDASSCGITIADAQQVEMPLLYVNDAFIRITGYTREEVLQTNCRFLQGGDRNQPALQTVRQAIRTGAHCQVILRNYRKDGTPFWNELYLSPIIYQGQITHFVGIQTDVTAREDAINAFLQKQEELAAALTQIKELQAQLYAK